jgi:hypothetical protein
VITAGHPGRLRPVTSAVRVHAHARQCFARKAGALPASGPETLTQNYFRLLDYLRLLLDTDPDQALWVYRYWSVSAPVGCLADSLRTKIRRERSPQISVAASPRGACRLPWSPEGRYASLWDRPSTDPSPDRRQSDGGGLWKAAGSVETNAELSTRRCPRVALKAIIQRARALEVDQFADVAVVRTANGDVVALWTAANNTTHVLGIMGQAARPTLVANLDGTWTRADVQGPRRGIVDAQHASPGQVSTDFTTSTLSTWESGPRPCFSHRLLIENDRHPPMIFNGEYGSMAF